MKFTDYLEAIQEDIYSELFNIDVMNVKMKKIKLKEEYDTSQYYMHNLARLVIDDKKSKKSLFTFLSSYSVDEIVNKYKTRKKDESLSERQIKDFKSFVEAFNQTKSGDAYIVRDENAAQKVLQFFIGNTSYLLHLSNVGGKYEINFGTYSVSNYESLNSNIKKNSIMSSERGGELFNKISSIVKNEVPNWRQAIFYFKPWTEDSEDKNKLNINDLFFDIFNFLGKYLVGLPTKSEFDKLKESMNIITHIGLKNKTKEVFTKEFSGLAKGSKADVKYAIDFVFSNDDVKTLKPPKKILKTIPEESRRTILFKDEAIVDEIANAFSMRSRLYRIIIKQIFGKDIFIKEKGGYTYFSKTDFKV